MESQIIIQVLWVKLSSVLLFPECLVLVLSVFMWQVMRKWLMEGKGHKG